MRLTKQGKTILASFIIDELRIKSHRPALAQADPQASTGPRSQKTTAFFYCKYEDDQRSSFLAVARGIISQVVSQNKSLVPYLYQKSKESHAITLGTVKLAKE